MEKTTKNMQDSKIRHGKLYKRCMVYAWKKEVKLVKLNKKDREENG